MPRIEEAKQKYKIPELKNDVHVEILAKLTEIHDELVKLNAR